MAKARFKKSTIVRAAERGVPSLLAAAEHVSPSTAARVAERMWFTVPRSAHTVRRTLPAGGRPFAVMVQRHVVRGVRWGDGPVVYLVHGWGGELSQLRAFVAPLVAAGHRVVAFDGPSHGASEAGTSGPGRSDAVALGRALDAVGARFGQPAAIVAHSMGALSSMLALRDGWLSTPRLALIAPATDLSTYLDRFFETWRIGPRSRRRFEERLEHRVGYAVDDFDVARISTDIARPDLLVVHDAGDRSTTYQGSVDLVQGWPGARLMTAQGLGHRRVLTDQHVVGEVVSFVTVREATVPSDLTA